jgi:hypothetical protein
VVPESSGICEISPRPPSRIYLTLSQAMTLVHTAIDTGNQKEKEWGVKKALEVVAEISARRQELTPIHLAMTHALVAAVGSVPAHKPAKHACRAMEICDRIIAETSSGRKPSQIAMDLSDEMARVLDMISNEAEVLDELRRERAVALRDIWIVNSDAESDDDDNTPMAHNATGSAVPLATTTAVPPAPATVGLGLNFGNS